MTRRPLFFSALILAISTTSIGTLLHAAERLPWPDKQGPKHDCHVSPEDAKGLPTEWDDATGKNIALKIPLEGQGLSSPIIGLGRVWMTSANLEGTQQFLYCLDEKTGEVLAHRLLFENVDPEPLFNKVNTYASPSCILEHDALYVHFGTYGTARIDTKTYETVWERRDINCQHFRGPGSSPAIFEDLIYLTMDGIDQQFVIALNKHTGETVWKVDRATKFEDVDEKGNPRAGGDYRKAYGTPMLIEIDGRMQLISPGAQAAFGYDARTGEEIWRLPYPTPNASCRPLLYKDYLVVHSGSVRARLICIRLDKSTLGDVQKSHFIWERDKLNSDLSCPVLVGDKIFMIASNGAAFCLDVKTGEELSRARIKGTFISSPLVANDMVYYTNDEGTTTVIKATTEMDIVSKNQLDDIVRSSPSAANGAIWIRGDKHLYKIVNQETQPVQEQR